MARDSHREEVLVVQRALVDMMQKVAALTTEAQRLRIRMDSVTGGSMPDGHGGEQASFEMGMALGGLHECLNRMDRAEDFLREYANSL